MVGAVKWKSCGRYLNRSGHWTATRAYGGLEGIRVKKTTARPTGKGGVRVFLLYGGRQFVKGVKEGCTTVGVSHSVTDAADLQKKKVRLLPALGIKWKKRSGQGDKSVYQQGQRGILGGGDVKKGDLLRGFGDCRSPYLGHAC